jgi:hypothetical protein
MVLCFIFNNYSMTNAVIFKVKTLISYVTNFLKKSILRPGMLAHAYNPTPQEVEIRRTEV